MPYSIGNACSKTSQKGKKNSGKAGILYIVSKAFIVIEPNFPLSLEKQLLLKFWSNLVITGKLKCRSFELDLEDKVRFYLTVKGDSERR